MQPSHLTRLVFRRLLSSQPIVHRGCLQRHPRQLLCRCNAGHIISASQQRSLWGFASKKGKERENKVPTLTPGLAPMLELSKSVRLGHRPPPPEQLADSFLLFFRSKAEAQEPCEDAQVVRASFTYDYLKERPRPDGEQWFPASELINTVGRALTTKPKDVSSQHVEFARRLYADIQGDVMSGPEEVKTKLLKENLAWFLRVLSNSGHTGEAFALLRQRIHGAPALDNLIHRGQNCWNAVIEGFVNEGNTEQLSRVLALAEESGFVVSARVHGILAAFYARNGDADRTKLHLARCTFKDVPLSTHIAVIECCRKENDTEWGHEILKSLAELLEKTQSQSTAKRLCDALFLWSVGVGKGVEELDRIRDVMIQRGGKAQPDVDTVNCLVELAMSRNDPYSAERFASLCERWNIRPNAKTYLLQLDYRLSVDDIDGARGAYQKLLSEEVENNQDVPSINRLIQAMIKSRRYDVQSLMNIVEDLAARRVRFEPETVAALCLFHLERDETWDVVDLLKAHAYNYSKEQRLLVREVFINFCLNRKNTVGRVWDAYQIMIQAFDESDREVRTRMMNEFFARGRSDMACHVFNDMRQQSRKEIRATSDTYVQVFAGIARTKDEDNLVAVHNYLKLDMDVEPGTRLLNALMMAYIACERPGRALDFWNEILMSREGPSYNSIIIAFRACEERPYGEEMARHIWSRLKRMDVEIDDKVFAAYLGALAGNGQIQEAQKLIENGERECGQRPNSLILGTFYNATPDSLLRSEVAHWIESKYPRIWERLTEGLKELRVSDTLMTMDNLPIDRPFEP